MTSVTIERETRTKTAAKVKARLTNTVGGMIDSLNEIREKKRSLEGQIKILDLEFAGIEETLSKAMDDQGMDKATGKKATVSFTATTVANVEDWDKFLEFIYENKYGHLFQRRVSDPAYRELLEMGTDIPGTTPFVKKRLNLRSI